MPFDPDAYLTSAAPTAAAFDPDAYLTGAAPTTAEFDPDAYLAGTTGFDPGAWLAERSEPAPPYPARALAEELDVGSAGASPAGAEAFDPESDGYDMQTALAGGAKPTLNPEDGLPHWQSRMPLSDEEAARRGVPQGSGLLLKGRKHKTWDKLVAGEEQAGYEIFKGPDGRYYSQQRAQIGESPLPTVAEAGAAEEQGRRLSPEERAAEDRASAWRSNWEVEKSAYNRMPEGPAREAERARLEKVLAGAPEIIQREMRAQGRADSMVEALPGFVMQGVAAPLAGLGHGLVGQAVRGGVHMGTVGAVTGAQDGLEAAARGAVEGFVTGLGLGAAGRVPLVSFVGLTKAAMAQGASADDAVAEALFLTATGAGLAAGQRRAAEGGGNAGRLGEWWRYLNERDPGRAVGEPLRPQFGAQTRDRAFYRDLVQRARAGDAAARQEVADLIGVASRADGPAAPAPAAAGVAPTGTSPVGGAAMVGPVGGRAPVGPVGGDVVSRPVAAGAGVASKPTPMPPPVAPAVVPRVGSPQGQAVQTLEAPAAAPAHVRVGEAARARLDGLGAAVPAEVRRRGEAAAAYIAAAQKQMDDIGLGVEIALVEQAQMPKLDLQDANTRRMLVERGFTEEELNDPNNRFEIVGRTSAGGNVGPDNRPTVEVVFDPAAGRFADALDVYEEVGHVLVNQGISSRGVEVFQDEAMAQDIARYYAGEGQPGRPAGPPKQEAQPSAGPGRLSPEAGSRSAAPGGTVPPDGARVNDRYAITRSKIAAVEKGQGWTPEERAVLTALDAAREIDARFGKARKAAKSSNRNLAKWNEWLKANPAERRAVEKIVRDLGGSMRLMDRGGLVGIPIEGTKDGSRKFHRSLGQMVLDRVSPDVFLSIHDKLNGAVEAAYAAGAKMRSPIPMDRSLASVAGESKEFRIQTPVREAKKTVAALNLNSACPTFTIGNRGCWGDACYLTQMANGNGVNLFERAMYAGEVLQMSEKDVAALREIGGLRVNGVGDTTPDNVRQLQTVIRHAAMRKLPVKIISKYEVTLKAVQEMVDRGEPVGDIQVQPSVDYWWTPVESDMADGTTGAREISEQMGGMIEAGLRADNPEMVSMVYDQLGRAVRKIDGKYYRKDGLTWEQVQALSRKYPDVPLIPRAVAASVPEIMDVILHHPDAVLTPMHGNLGPGVRSEMPGELFNFGAARHEFLMGKDGRAIVRGDKSSPEVEGERKPSISKAGYRALEDAINKLPPASRRAVIERLQKQTCCQANDSPDACASCASHCAARVLARLPGVPRAWPLWKKGATDSPEQRMGLDRYAIRKVRGEQDVGYRGVHRAPSGEHGAGSLDAMDRTYPDDVYSPDAARLYGHRSDVRMDAESARIIRRMRGKPDAEVTVYRAVPKGVAQSINAGDWVTTVRGYAASHGERFDEGYDILERKVKAGELFTEGNSLLEFGWMPGDTRYSVRMVRGQPAAEEPVAAPAAEPGTRLRPEEDVRAAGQRAGATGAAMTPRRMVLAKRLREARALVSTTQGLPRNIHNAYVAMLNSVEAAKIGARADEDRIAMMVAGLVRAGNPRPAVLAGLRGVQEGTETPAAWGARMGLAATSPEIRTLERMKRDIFDRAQEIANWRGLPAESADWIRSNAHYTARAYLRMILGEDYSPPAHAVHDAVHEVEAGLMGAIAKLERQATAVRGATVRFNVLDWFTTGDARMLAGLAPTRARLAVRVRENWLKIRDLIDTMAVHGNDVVATANARAVTQAADGIVGYYLGRESEGIGQHGGLDISNLSRRFLESPAFREMYGEVTDPAMRQRATAEAQGKLLAHMTFLNRVLAEGEGTVWWHRPDAPRGFTERLGDPTSGADRKRFGALVGKYATPQFLDVVKGAQNSGEHWQTFKNLWLGPMSITRLLHLLNPRTIVRNWYTGWLGNGMASGDAVLPTYWSRWAEAHRIAFDYARGAIRGAFRRVPTKRTVAARDALAEAARLGYYSPSASSTTFDIQATLGGMSGRMAAVERRLANGYAMVDFMSKHAAYWARRDAGMSPEEATEHVAQMYQNRHRVPQLAGKVTRWGIADYLGYTVDSVRFTANEMRWAAKSAARGDYGPMVGFALSRALLWSMALAVGQDLTTRGFAWMHRQLRRMRGQKSAMMGPLEQDREEALRTFLPDYDRNMPLMVWEERDAVKGPLMYYAVAGGQGAFPVDDWFVGALQGPARGQSYLGALSSGPAQQLDLGMYPGMILKAAVGTDFLGERTETGKGLVQGLFGQEDPRRAEIIQQAMKGLAVDFAGAAPVKIIGRLMDLQADKAAGKEPAGIFARSTTEEDVLASGARLIRVYRLEKGDMNAAVARRLAEFGDALKVAHGMIADPERDTRIRGGATPEQRARADVGEKKRTDYMNRMAELVRSARIAAPAWYDNGTVYKVLISDRVGLREMDAMEVIRRSESDQEKALPATPYRPQIVPRPYQIMRP